ncbi:MAG: hypothetical protein RMJ67_03660 [Elusimicrobiota bacterium]|nr:hypothetical protein [Endomicrobiia bacterium]MDW8165588.1 hypothetical protein [Elusimicrobiota bacterium]
MVKNIFILFLFLSLTHLFSAGFDGLKLFFGVKATGLGENLSALSGEIESIYHNPAGLVGLSPFEFKIMYLNWVAGINRGDLIFAKSFKDKSTIGLSFNYMWTALESENGSFSYLFFINDIAYAKKFNKIYFGLSTKLVYESTSLDEGYNLAGGLNLGLMFRKQRLTFGASIKNIGLSFVSMGETLEVLPTNLNFGISYIMANNMMLLSSFRYQLDGFASIHTGIEFPIYRGIKEDISIRVGNIIKISYYENDLPLISNFRFGFGFRKEGLRFDYSLIPLGEDVGFFHYLALGFMFY